MKFSLAYYIRKKMPNVDFELNQFSALQKEICLTIGLTGRHKLKAVDAHGLASEFGKANAVGSFLVEKNTRISF